MKKNGGWGFFPPLKSTAEMCADSLTLPEIDKSECCANVHRKSSPVQRRSATSHAGLQTDMHLTFLAPKPTFSRIFCLKICPISSDLHEECSTATKHEDKHLILAYLHKQNHAYRRFYNKKGRHLSHCSFSQGNPQCNAQHRSCKQTSGFHYAGRYRSQGMFALGTMAVIRNTVLNDAKRVFGVYLCRPVSGHHLTPATLARTNQI